MPWQNVAPFSVAIHHAVLDVQMDDVSFDLTPNHFEIGAFCPGVVGVPQYPGGRHLLDEGEKLFKIRKRIMGFDHQVDVQSTCLSNGLPIIQQRRRTVQIFRPNFLAAVEYPQIGDVGSLCPVDEGLDLGETIAPE